MLTICGSDPRSSNAWRMRVRGRSTVLIVIALCVAALVGCYMFNYPVYTYRYRLTINIELDGKVHSGSSVIEIGWQEGIKLGDAGGFAPLIRGQAAIVDLSDRGVVIATLITGEGYGTAGDGALAAISIVPRAFGKASTAEQIPDLPNLRGKRNLEANDLPRFLWLSSKDDVTTARKLHVQEIPEVLGPSARFAGTSVEITEDPIVIDIRERLPWLKSLDRKRPEPDPIYLPDGLGITRYMFIGDGS
jgi:hypothetical protein